MIRRIIIAVIVLGIVATGAWALWPRPMRVETAQIERRSLEVSVEEEGKSRIREVFTVSAPVTGQLTRTALHAGDGVVRGVTVVASIRPADPGLLDDRSRRIAEAAVETAEAALALASSEVTRAETQYRYLDSELERTVLLADRGLVPQSMLEKASFDASAAKSLVESAKATLVVRQRELDSARATLMEGDAGTAGDSCCVEVRAPITGEVLQVATESEQVVQAGTPLMQLGNPADLEIVVDLLSRDAVRVEPGAMASIDGWGGQQLKAEVARVDPIAVTKVSALGIEEQRTTVILHLLDPPNLWSRLGHGFRVVARIVVWQQDDLLAVPMAALFRVGEDWATFVVENGVAHTRLVSLGERNADYAEVKDGLVEGDAVIVHPSDLLVDGAAVAPLKAAAQ